MAWFMSHILTIVTFVPLFGALLLLLVNKEKKRTIMLGATWIAGIDFVLSLPLFFNFDAARGGFQFVERAPWIPSIGVQYLLGIDGISLLLLLLTTFLGL